jgi:hypothetical protein
LILSPKYQKVDYQIVDSSKYKVSQTYSKAKNTKIITKQDVNIQDNKVCNEMILQTKVYMGGSNNELILESSMKS